MVGSSSDGPEQPATLPQEPGCTRAPQELDRAGRDLAVTGCPCPFLSFHHSWHVVCGGCQVPAAIGMIGPQDGEVLLLEWGSLYIYFFHLTCLVGCHYPHFSTCMTGHPSPTAPACT